MAIYPTPSGNGFSVKFKGKWREVGASEGEGNPYGYGAASRIIYTVGDHDHEDYPPWSEIQRLDSLIRDLIDRVNVLFGELFTVDPRFITFPYIAYGTPQGEVPVGTVVAKSYAEGEAEIYLSFESGSVFEVYDPVADDWVQSVGGDGEIMVYPIDWQEPDPGIGPKEIYARLDVDGGRGRATQSDTLYVDFYMNDLRVNRVEVSLSADFGVGADIEITPFKQLRLEDVEVNHVYDDHPDANDGTGYITVKNNGMTSTSFTLTTFNSHYYDSALARLRYISTDDPPWVTILNDDGDPNIELITGTPTVEQGDDDDGGNETFAVTVDASEELRIFPRARPKAEGTGDGGATQDNLMHIGMNLSSPYDDYQVIVEAVNYNLISVTPDMDYDFGPHKVGQLEANQPYVTYTVQNESTVHAVKVLVEWGQKYATLDEEYWDSGYNFRLDADWGQADPDFEWYNAANGFWPNDTDDGSDPLYVEHRLKPKGDPGGLDKAEIRVYFAPSGMWSLREAEIEFNVWYENPDAPDVWVEVLQREVRGTGVADGAVFDYSHGTDWDGSKVVGEMDFGIVTQEMVNEGEERYLTFTIDNVGTDAGTVYGELHTSIYERFVISSAVLNDMDGTHSDVTVTEITNYMTKFAETSIPAGGSLTLELKTDIDQLPDGYEDGYYVRIWDNDEKDTQLGQFECVVMKAVLDAILQWEFQDPNDSNWYPVTELDLGMVRAGATSSGVEVEYTSGIVDGLRITNIGGQTGTFDLGVRNLDSAGVFALHAGDVSDVELAPGASESGYVFKMTAPVWDESNYPPGSTEMQHSAVVGPTNTPYGDLNLRGRSGRFYEFLGLDTQRGEINLGQVVRGGKSRREFSIANVSEGLSVGYSLKIWGDSVGNFTDPKLTLYEIDGLGSCEFGTDASPGGTVSGTIQHIGSGQNTVARFVIEYAPDHDDPEVNLEAWKYSGSEGGSKPHGDSTWQSVIIDCDMTIQGESQEQGPCITLHGSVGSDVLWCRPINATTNLGKFHELNQGLFCVMFENTSGGYHTFDPETVGDAILCRPTTYNATDMGKRNDPSGNGSTYYLYRMLIPHVCAADNEPGVGANWEYYWSDPFSDDESYGAWTLGEDLTTDNPMSQAKVLSPGEQHPVFIDRRPSGMDTMGGIDSNPDPEEPWINTTAVPSGQVSYTVRGNSGSLDHTVLYEEGSGPGYAGAWWGTLGDEGFYDLGELRAGRWLEAWNKRILIGVRPYYVSFTTAGVTIGNFLMDNWNNSFSLSAQAPFKFKDPSNSELIGWDERPFTIDGDEQSIPTSWGDLTHRYRWNTSYFTGDKEIAYFWFVPYISTTTYNAMPVANKWFRFQLMMRNTGSNDLHPVSPMFQGRALAASTETEVVLSPQGGDVFTIGDEVTIVWTGTNDVTAVDVSIKSVSQGFICTVIYNDFNEGRCVWDTSDGSPSAGDDFYVALEIGGTTTNLAYSDYFSLVT